MDNLPGETCGRCAGVAWPARRSKACGRKVPLVSFFSTLITAVAPAVRSALRTATQPKSRRTAPRNAPSHPAAPGSAQQPPPPAGGSPGRTGTDRTVEVDPHAVGTVRTTYSPVSDGDPDPGEIVWTWVPYQENDGQGKDRPVLVVAAEPTGTVLVVQLTSKTHEGDDEFVPVGSGDWDSAHRPSWVNLERVLRVHPLGMRREASALGRQEFDRVADRLRKRYGWS